MRNVALCAALLMSIAVTPIAQADELSYQTPPKAIADLVDIPPTPSVSLGPDGTTLLLMQAPTLPPISEVSQPELRLAGLRINPKTSGPSRRGHLIGLSLLALDDKKAKPR